MSQRDIFIAALQKNDAAERRIYLDEACGTDAALRDEIEGLLRVHEKAGSFLEPSLQTPAATMDAPVRERLGAMIGPYKLIEQIGEGGMGTVWMAQQTEPVKRVVAVKLIKAGMDSKQVIARFEAERQALALMDHANIARVLDAGATSAGRPYFVMDLVKGVPITKYCDEHHLTPRQRLELFIPVCQAIQHAHQKGIIHRDLKPSNVLVALYDGKPVPKVIDFGVAKAAGQSLTDKTLVTGFGTIVGTLEYMSPEQAEINQLDIDTRSDIYSLGVLLYELLTGSPPFTRKELTQGGMLEMLRVIREQEPSKPSTKLSTAEGLPTLAANRGTEPAKLTKLVRGELDWIVMKTLEKDRNRRYETANGFAADVQRYLNDEPVLACPPSAIYRLRKFVRRHKAGLAVAGVILFFLLLLGSGAGWAVRDRAAGEEERARERTERLAKVAGQVELILGEVERLETEQKWPDALAAARRAQAALSGGEADPDTSDRVRQVLADLDMVARLEEIRLGARDSAFRSGTFDRSGAIRLYAAAFREYGVDVDSLPAVEAAARLRPRAALVIPLAAALDYWAYCQRSTKDEDSAKALWALAGAIDPDLWRLRLREAVAARDSGQLRALAESPETARQPPQSQVLLASFMYHQNHLGQVIALLERAGEAHPGDFWVHFGLAEAHSYARPRRSEAIVRHLTAARALRPRSATTWSNLGTELSHQKKLDAAIACYNKAIELDPKLANAYSSLGIALRAQKKVPEAVAAYHKAIEIDPKHANAYTGLGNALCDQGNLDEAIACHKNAIDLNPKLAAAHNNLGVILYDKGDYAGASACFRKTIELDPETATAHHNLGNCLVAQKKFDEASACYRKAIELDPEYPDAHNKLGNSLVAQKKFDEAIAAFRKAIEIDPKHPHAYNGLGNALSNQKKLPEAIAAYHKAIEIDPKHPHAYNGLGNALFDQKKLADAVAAYHKAIEIDPQYAYAYNGLGIALFNQKKLPDAVVAYHKAIEIDPKLALAYNGLGIALRAQNKLPEAIAAFHKAIEIHPQYAIAYNNVGLALRDQKKLPEAIAAYHKAIEIDPSYARAYDGLGSALRGQQKLDEAIAAYRKAIEFDPKDARAYNNLGSAQMAQGKLDEAVSTYRKAVEVNPNFAIAYIGLGVALMAQGKPDDAIAAYRKAMELDPRVPVDHIQLGAVAAKLNKVDDAIAFYRKCIELHPKNVLAYYNLGILLCDRKKDYPGAVAAFRKAISLEPNSANASAHFNLGFALRLKGDGKEAIASFREAIRLQPTHARSHTNLARCLTTCSDVEHRKPKEALEAAKKGVELAPQSDQAWLVLGWANYRVGEFQASIAALEKSMALPTASKGGNPGHWFFLAMAHWQLDHTEEARRWYDRAVAWMDKRASRDEEVQRIRAEAEQVLEIKKK